MTRQKISILGLRQYCFSFNQSNFKDLFEKSLFFLAPFVFLIVRKLKIPLSLYILIYTYNSLIALPEYLIFGNHLITFC